MATVGNGSAARPKAKAQPRPYRDFLTPSLHRRFTRAALIALVACWITSLFFTPLGWFWSWFPLGPAGVRALFLFISSLSIFTLRVAQLHFGQRSTISTFESFWHYALAKTTVQTCFWYLLSAFLFGELYIFSTPRSANLSMIDPGRSYERPKLNERPVLLRCQFVLVALAQSAMHLYNDYDLIRLPKTPHNKSPLSQLRHSLRSILGYSVQLVLFNTMVGPFLYFAFLRPFAWSLAFKVAKTFHSLPRAARPSGLTDAATLMARSFCSSLLLVFLWDLSNRVFTIYTSQEPVKKDKPLTAESKDPNGSLILGLKAKKEIPKTMAFWELAIISQRFDERRKTLFQDLDRPGGSTWSQILNICLSEIQSVGQRIQDSQGPLAEPSDDPDPLWTLPKISSQALKNDPVFNTAPAPSSKLQAFGESVGSVAKSFGQNAGAANPVSPRAQKLLEYGANRVLSKEQQEQLSRAHVTKQASGLLSSIVRTPLGMPFRQPFARRIGAVIFGVPFSSGTIITYAVQSICGLAVSSLKEDNLGQVQKDIKTIVSTLVSTIQKIQKFVHTQPPHWTDVDFNGDKRVPEVDALLDVLRDGLHEIVVTFGEYAENLGISRTEIMIAKELAGRGPEMESIR